MIVRIILGLVPVAMVGLIVFGIVRAIRAANTGDPQAEKYKDLNKQAAHVMTEILISNGADDISILSEHDKALLDKWMTDYRKVHKVT